MKPVRVLAPLLVLLAAGCAQPSGATAFVVDGQNTSQDMVDATAAGCAAIAQQPTAAVRTQVAQFLLLGEVADAVSRRTNTPITAAMETAGLKQVGGSALMKDEACAPAARAVARFAAVTGKLGKEKSRQAVDALDVQVNPAYGQWDPSKVSFTGTSGSLSRQDLGQGKVFG